MIAKLFCRLFGHRFSPFHSNCYRCLTCGEWFPREGDDE